MRPAGGGSVHLGRRTLETFSACVLGLDQLPAGLSPPRLMDAGLDLLHTMVPFDAAWWGECSGGMEGAAPRNWLSGRRGLGADMVREWQALSASDQFAQASLTHLDQAVSVAGFEDPVPEVEAFARRHNLCHVLAITRELPGSGLLQFLSLYRHEGASPFGPEDSLLFEQFTAHLMHRWCRRVAALIEAGAAPGDDQALVDDGGQFVYVGRQLALWLAAQWPGWDGGPLPPALAQVLRRVPGQWRVGGRSLAAMRCGELVLMNLLPRRRAPVLPPRELHVAQLFAEGLSHKAIAQRAGLSPSTVRTYLRDAYLRLGVSDRVALGRCLAASSPRGPRR